MTGKRLPDSMRPNPAAASRRALFRKTGDPADLRARPTDQEREPRKPTTKHGSTR